MLMSAIFMLVSCGSQDSDSDSPPQTTTPSTPSTPTNTSPTPITPNTHKNYTVTYKSEYGTAPQPLTIQENTVLSSANLPEINFAGYYEDSNTYIKCTFEGWYMGSTKLTAGSFTITDNITLIAKWSKTTEINTPNTKINISIPANNDISLVPTKNGLTWTLTATQGYQNYSWRIDDEVQTGTSNTLTLETSSWLTGNYTVTVEAEKGGQSYSAFAYITVGEN